MRRSLIESLERRKEMMIAALWANSGFEGKEGADARSEAITNLEESYEEAVKLIQSSTDEPEQEEDVDANNPFWAAMERGKSKIQEPAHTSGTVSDAIDDQYKDMKIDQ